MKKRGLAWFLTLSLLVSLLAGCGSNAGPGTQADGKLPKDDASQEITISYWMYADDYKHYNSLNENPVVEYLNKMFNVKFEFQTPAIGSEANNFSLMLGTQDYTDIMNMTYYTGSLNTLYNDGVILDLAPYVEEYMPNYFALLQSNDELRKSVYDDEGHLFSLAQIDNTERTHWGGMVYRHDILETMTGGNVQFPSGNDTPTTVEDWDYMLPLMKQYFEATGMPDTACLILPAVGYMATGELQAGWGAGGTLYLDEACKKIEYTPATDRFYNYLVKMNEWYEAGYIYADFASRTNDMFYLPNPALTYGGAAGVWFGLLGQLSDHMSIPEYNLFMDVRALAAPLDTEHGITEEQAGARVTVNLVSAHRCIAATVKPEKLVRILKIMDYLYSQEGAILANRGLTGEAAANNKLYQKLGMPEGTYWFDENGGLNIHERYNNAVDYNIEPMSLTGQRLSCAMDATANDTAVNLERDKYDDAEDAADLIWKQYPIDRVVPGGVTLNDEESQKFNAVYTDINDYVNSMIPKFIIGTEELNEDTWAKYLAHLEQLGLQSLVDAQQSAYDRYLKR